VLFNYETTELQPVSRKKDTWKLPREKYSLGFSSPSGLLRVRNKKYCYCKD